MFKRLIISLLVLLSLSINYVCVLQAETTTKPFLVTFYELNDINKVEKKIGEFSTFAEASSSCVGGQLNKQYIITVLKDYTIEESESFEHKYEVNLIIRSSKGNRFTLTRKGKRMLLGLTNQSNVYIENLILDGNNESSLMTVLAYDNASQACALTLANDTIIRNFTYNDNFTAGPIYLCGYVTLNILKGAILEDNNSIAAGGVIQAVENATINIDGASFKNNKSSTYGGAISGSGIINISDSIFIDNKSDKAGGAIVAFDTSKVNIQRCTFKNNFSSTGGSIYAMSKDYFNVVNSTLENNIAKWGGAIFASGKINIQNSSFINNQANKDGGALYLGKESLANISANTLFEGNKANDMGGAIYSENYKYNDGVNPQKDYHNIVSDKTTLFLNNFANGGLYNPPLNAQEFTNLSFSDKSDVKHSILSRLSLLNNYDLNYQSNYRVYNFSANGGKFSDESTNKVLESEVNTIIKLLSGPKKDGFQFVGWDGEKLQPNSDYVVKDNHNFIAQWINEPPILEVADKEINENENVDLKSLILKVEDKEDGKIDNNAVAIDDSNLDITKVGIYTITYTIVDKGGNKVSKQATIKVVKNNHPSNSVSKINNVKKVVNTASK